MHMRDPMGPYVWEQKHNDVFIKVQKKPLCSRLWDSLLPAFLLFSPRISQTKVAVASDSG